MNISFKYDDVVWTRFKQVAKERYGMDATAAMKRLIDYVVREEDIPGVSPLLSVDSGDYKPEESKNGEKVPY